VNSSVTVSIRHNECAVGRYGKVCWSIEWQAGPAYRTIIIVGYTCICCLTADADRHQQVPVTRELSDRLIGVICTVNQVIGANVDAMWAYKHLLAPRVDEPAIAFEDDDWMLAVPKNVDSIFAICCDACYID
jgi:hypothetical protein